MSKEDCGPTGTRTQGLSVSSLTKSLSSSATGSQVSISGMKDIKAGMFHCALVGSEKTYH